MHNRHLVDLVRDQHPLTMPPDGTVAEACAAMHRRRVGAMLVVDEKRHLLGIFTGRDALRCLAEHANPGAMPLRAVMSANPCTMETSGSAMDALRLLNDAGIRHLPIVDQGKLMGIVSRYDFRQMEHRRLDEESGFFELLR
jgi:CBS domain-containing protein